MSILEARHPVTGDIVRIDFASQINSVDEVIHPPHSDLYVAQGFVDLQVNGFAGVDYNDPASTHEAIERSIERMFSTGVTRFLPTVITGPESRIVAALRNLSAFAASGSAAAPAIAGFHIEGPNISHEDGPRGAHPRQHVRPPDWDEFQRWQEAARGNIRLITVSPEWPGMPEYVQRVTRSGVVVSVGHTRATSDQIKAVVDAGATKSTHLGNGAHAVLPKTNNYIWDQMVEDRLAAAFIVDGIHIPSAFFRAALRAKGVERSILVSDAVMPVMCEPGPYRLGEVDVELHANNVVTLRGGTRLAGSALRMDHAVGNAVRMGSLRLVEALAMATVNPARVAKIAARQRGLSAGDKADLVEFSWDEPNSTLEVKRTFLAGREVFRKAE